MQKKRFLLNHLIKQYVDVTSPLDQESLKSCLRGRSLCHYSRTNSKILGQDWRYRLDAY